MSFNNFAKVSQDISSSIKKQVIEAVEFGKDMAKSNVAVDTGLLQSTIQIDINDSKIILSAGRAINDARAIVNEYGSRFRAAKPYMSPAFQVIRRKIDEIKVK